MALLSFLFLFSVSPFFKFDNPRGITFRGVLRGQAVDKHKGEDYHIVSAEMCQAVFTKDTRK
jgi:hypothetical protein